MILSIILALYPLQVNVNSFNIKGGGNALSTRQIIIFVIVAAVFIISLTIINAVKKTTPGAKSTGAFSGLFSSIALQRLAGNIGLNNDQTRMLSYVFKTDSVADPEKSINTPELLDRHFRRAYRTIEQTSKSEQEIQNRLAVLFSTRNLLENCAIGTISSTRQLKDDASLIINTGKEKLTVRVYSTKNEFLLVETPKNVLGSQIKMPKGTRLNVMFFLKNNKGFSFETRVTGFATHNGLSAIQLAHSNNLRFLSLRRFRRRQIVIACVLNLVYVEGSGKKQRMVVDKRHLSGNIADISVGGCSIKTTQPVKVGARFKIQFTQGDNNVTALGQVLRTNRKGASNIIHIRFLRVTQKSMNIINAFVYEYAND